MSIPSVLHRQSPRRFGFSLLEMLVAIAITLILVLFLNSIFGSVKDAVSVGLSMSDIIEHNRIMSETFQNDEANMQGPLAEGFLMIVQKEYYAGVPGQYDNLRLLPENDAPPSYAVRSDQLIYIRSIESGNLQKPSTPNSENSFNEPDNTSAKNGRLFYGHVRRTNPNGAPGEPLGEVGVNQVASNWLLGRQLLFFEKDVTSNPDPSSPSNPIYIDYNATSSVPDWRIKGYTALPSHFHVVPADPPNEPPYFTGLSDRINLDITQIVRDFIGPNAASPTPGYPFGPYKFGFMYERLWANPHPVIDLNQDGDATNPTSFDDSFQSWQYAQSHPIIASNVSHFEVEFAGDFATYDPITGTNIPIPDNNMDRDPVTGGIAWYDHFHRDHRSAGESAAVAAAAKRDGIAPPNSFGDQNSPTVNVATLNLNPIPIYHFRNRIESDGSTTTPSPAPPPLADAVFTWKPGIGDGLLWPSMIRIRYRMHDKKGQLQDIDQFPGKFFESIIQVKKF